MQYLLKRTHRKSIRVTVSKGSLFVFAPVYASIKQIEEVVAYFKKKYPDYEKLVKQSAQMPNNIFIKGEEVAAESAGGCDYNNLLKILAKYKRYYIDRVKELEKVCGVCVSEIAFGKYRAKWGSMDAKKRLRLNNLIFMLEDNLSDYLIVHELCHIKQLNHSAKFWSEVEKIMPDYKTRRQLLKKKGFLIRQFT